MHLWCAYIYTYVYLYIYIRGYTYAHQVYIYINTGIHCYTSASWRQLKGYGVWADSLSFCRSQMDLFPVPSQLYQESCCSSILEALCLPVTTCGRNRIWQVLVCRKLTSWHPTHWQEGSGLDHKKVEITGNPGT